MKKDKRVPQKKINTIFDIENYRKSWPFRLFAICALLGVLVILSGFGLSFALKTDPKVFRRLFLVGFEFLLVPLAGLHLLIILVNRRARINGEDAYMSFTRFGIQFSRSYFSTQFYLSFILLISLLLIALIARLF